MNFDPHARLFSHSPLFQLAVSFTAGILFATHSQIKTSYLLIALALASVATFVGLHSTRLNVAGCALLTAVFFAATCFTSLEQRSTPNRLKKLIEERVVPPTELVELTGTITGPVEYARDGLHFSLEIDSLKTTSQTKNCSGVVALQGWYKDLGDERSYRQMDLQSASHLSVITKLDRTEQYQNPGVPMLAAYLDTRGIDAMALLRGPKSITRVDAPDTFSFGRILYHWRAFLQRQINSRFSIETAGVLDAALLGNRHNLSHATADRFREGGTFHVLVISGAHISFIGGLILLLMRRLIVRRWLQFGFAALIVWCYAFAVGADTSVVRAALMFTFVVFGSLLYRKASPINSLGGAALVLLVWSPKDIFDPALQLTFLSVLAILVIAWPILRNLSDIGKWRPSREAPYPPASSTIRSFSEALYWSENSWQQELQKLSHNYRLFKSPASYWLEKHHLQIVLRYTFSAVVVSAAVQVVLLPLQVIYFHRLSVSSVILTIVVGILLAALATVALAALLISQINSVVAEPLIKLADALDWLMIHSVDPFAEFGIASMRLAEYSGWTQSVYGLYYLPLLLIAVALSHWKPLASPTLRNGSKNRLVVLLCIQLGMSLLLVLHPKSARTNEGKLELTFLDVGQGDSVLLTMPDGSTLLIDGGGRPIFDGESKNDSAAVEREQRSIGERVVCEYLWARGLASVDYVLATHADSDHIDGLNDVVRNFHVRGAIVGRTPTRDIAYEKLARTLNDRKIPLQVVQAGDVLRFGDVEIEVLWPPTSDASAPSQNNDSVVLRVKFGERMFLLTGDIEKGTEELLITREQVRADVVKVPHHGSKSSSTFRFVAAVRPSVAVISVGKRSIFGHPHKEVVERWKAIGAEVLTTGRSGTITIMTDGQNLAISKFVQE